MVQCRALYGHIKTLGAHCICFGSDTPFELTHMEVAKYHALLEEEVTPEEKALIITGTIARVLGYGTKEEA